jgi:MYXO-CTERM domain-containing protein
VVTTLVGPNGETGDAFGGAVALHGSNVVVGAPGKNSQTGAAYAYVVNAGGPGGPQSTATPTATPGRGIDDDGCAVTAHGSDSGVGLALLAIPLLIALRRR